MDQETAKYITNYFSIFFTENESKAWRHWSSEYKLMGFETEESRESRRKFYFKTGFMTENIEVLTLLEGGIDQFQIRTAERILNDRGSQIFLNNCPECGKLARTPKAKQCRHCGHNWHLKKSEPK